MMMAERRLAAALLIVLVAYVASRDVLRLAGLATTLLVIATLIFATFLCMRRDA